MVTNQIAWSKVWLVASALGLALVLGACGKDNGDVVAGTPQPKCQSNCQWGALPYGWSYPPNYGGSDNQTYSGYNDRVQCGYNTVPIYRQGYPTICAPVESFGHGLQPHYGGYQWCDATTGSGCVPAYQTNPTMGHHWNTPTYATWGIRPRQ